MKESDRQRLQHMFDAATEALSFAQGKTSSDPLGDRLLTLALTKEIEIIGEAAGRVSEECKINLPAIPWSLLVALRNRLIHAYFAVDPQIVWFTVSSDLPRLVRELEIALGDHLAGQPSP